MLFLSSKRKSWVRARTSDIPPPPHPASTSPRLGKSSVGLRNALSGAGTPPGAAARNFKGSQENQSPTGTRRSFPSRSSVLLCMHLARIQPVLRGPEASRTPRAVLWLVGRCYSVPLGLNFGYLIKACLRRQGGSRALRIPGLNRGGAALRASGCLSITGYCL